MVKWLQSLANSSEFQDMHINVRTWISWKETETNFAHLQKNVQIELQWSCKTEVLRPNKININKKI
jgi:hypothetical protein